MTWPASEGAQGMERRLDEMCAEASELVERGVNIIILSDRNLGAERVAMPALLATAAVHHHLVREGTRLQSGLIVETGQAKEIHHVACLIGYGASAVNPYVMFESLYALHREGRLPEGMAPDEAVARTIKAIGKGLLKILSKMGISTIRSYTGAQIFEAVGLDEGARRPPLHRHAVARRRRGAERARLGVPRPPRARLPRGQLRAAAGRRRLRLAPRRRVPRLEPRDDRDAPAGGARGGRRRRLRALRHLRERGGRAEVRRCAGCSRFNEAPEPVPLDEVEPAAEIVKRFKSGRDVARRAVARGARDARGGHEPPRRQVEHRRGRGGPGALRRRAPLVDQAGRVGPLRRDRRTTWSNADELQIKVAQGAKPGEGGQLPGHKVDRYIARLRHSTPGVGLISPPPHHDIYSIEDLKQLIYDLRCANPRARVSVKLVVRGRRGHGRGGRGEGERRPRRDRRPRRRHRRLAAGVDPARRHPVGDRARGDPADAAPQRPALADPRGGRRPDAHRPRRRRRRASSAPTSTASRPPR